MVLKKRTNDIDYGFSLAYSNSFMGLNEPEGGHVVHWVDKGGPANVGGLRDGDKIIAVSRYYLL